MASYLTVPNALTLIRLALLPVCIVLFRRGYGLGAALLFVAAMLTDSLDGFFARRLRQRSTFGTYLDPVVDKIVILTFFYELAGADLLPFAFAHLFLARELLQNAVRCAAAHKGVIVGANWMGKTKSALQVCIIAGCLILPEVQNLLPSGAAALCRRSLLLFASGVLLLSWLFFARFVLLTRARLRATP